MSPILMKCVLYEHKQRLPALWAFFTVRQGSHKSEPHRIKNTKGFATQCVNKFLLTSVSVQNYTTVRHQNATRSELCTNLFLFHQSVMKSLSPII